MTRRLVSISTLTFIHSETSVPIVGSVGQSNKWQFYDVPVFNKTDFTSQV